MINGLARRHCFILAKNYVHIKNSQLIPVDFILQNGN